MIVRPDLCPLAQLSGIQSIEMIILQLKTSLRQYYSVVILLEHLAPRILHQLTNTGWVIILRDYTYFILQSYSNSSLLMVMILVIYSSTRYTLEYY